MPNKIDRQISQEDLDKAIATIDIPACPAIVINAMQEAQKDEPDINRLAEIITKDPGMSAAALKMANSPLYGAGGRISVVRKAVERLGIKNVVSVIVTMALRTSMAGLPAAWLDQFWKQTTLVAIVASLVARRQYAISPDAVYTYALFHDAAIPLMMRRYPNYGEVLDQHRNQGNLLTKAESDLFHCTHPIIASLLVRNWGLPPQLGQAIRFHHEEDAYELPEQTLPGSALSLIAVTHVAEHLLAETLDDHGHQVGEPLFTQAQAYLGISDSDLDDLRHQVEEVIAEGADYSK